MVDVTPADHQYMGDASGCEVLALAIDRHRPCRRASGRPLNESECCQRLEQLKNARQFAAWIGLVPHKNSSGGKTQLLGNSKRGDVNLRTLLIHGGRALVQLAKTRAADRAGTWLGRLIAFTQHCCLGDGQQERAASVCAAVHGQGL
jgi:hypothetical protein